MNEYNVEDNSGKIFCKYNENTSKCMQKMVINP